MCLYFTLHESYPEFDILVSCDFVLQEYKSIVFTDIACKAIIIIVKGHSSSDLSFIASRLVCLPSMLAKHYT